MSQRDEGILRKSLLSRIFKFDCIREKEDKNEDKVHARCESLTHLMKDDVEGALFCEQFVAIDCHK
jgi:hypothetical protein